MQTTVVHNVFKATRKARTAYTMFVRYDISIKLHWKYSEDWMANIYGEGYFYSDLENWNSRILRSDDQFPALCYAFGISPGAVTHQSIESQLSYIFDMKTRTPEHVLEIGAGRGEVSCALSKLGVDVTAVDIAKNIQRWFNKTGKQFFGDDFIVPTVIESSIKDLALDFKKFDTIIMVESFEHIREEDFQSTWANICENFKGLFCITNLPHMHPIPIGSWAPGAEEHHCRVIDDGLFDSLAAQAKNVVFRERSHLVLEF